MTEREQIIEAMARAMDELPTASTMDRMGLARSLAVAALDAALPLILREAADAAAQALFGSAATYGERQRVTHAILALNDIHGPCRSAPDPCPHSKAQTFAVGGFAKDPDLSELPPILSPPRSLQEPSK